MGQEEDGLMSASGSSDDELEGYNGHQVSHCPGVCCTTIPSGSVGVVQDCGEYKGWAEPGCICFCPGIRSIMPVSLAVQMFSCRSDCKTKDQVLITVTTSVQYRINKKMLKEAVFDIVHPEDQIRSHVDSVLRSTLPNLDLDEAYAAKEHVCDQIMYGHDILNVLVTDLQPEATVQQAMNAINAARRNREAAAETAEAQKILAVKAAEADAEAKFLSGQGVARMRLAMAEGFQQSMQTMSSGGLTPQESMHMMVTTQYLDTLKDFANNPNSSSIMVPHGPGAVRDIERQVADGFAGAAGAAKPRQARMLPWG
eukprot:TRINITY_DN24188_c1_g2_i1.p2 TRINITY_DN24188_c1_g2~~TRINITY_DN24188_c1_g2_i1.p2  ORF type:complete len:312 (-),score=81.34 TRINITY_DN24188_c1_g2_i1:15-950(-)